MNSVARRPRLFHVLLLCLIACHARAATHYVDLGASGSGNGTSWADAFNDLQAALTTAVSNDEVRVASGTYKPSSVGDRNASFTLKPGLALFGGYPNGGGTRDWIAHVTTLSGDINTLDDPTDNSAHVVVGAHLARIDGFTITKGFWDSNDTGWREGAGLYVDGNKFMTIANCRFVENHSWYRGAGIYFGFVNNSGVGPLVSNCTFKGNSTTYSAAQGGALHTFHRVPITVVDSRFEDNTSAYGGAIWSQYSDLIIERCVFARNSAVTQGGAIWTSRPDLTAVTPLRIVDSTFFANRTTAGTAGALYCDRSDYKEDVISGCRFYANDASHQGGAVYLYRYNGTLEDAIISGNRSFNSEGGAVHSAYGSPILRRLIASGNISGYRGGALYLTGHPSYPSSPKLENILAAGNTALYDGGAAALYYLYGGTATLVNCTFTTNRTLLVNTAYSGGGLWLQESLACVTNSILYGNRANGGAGHEATVVGVGSRTTWGYNDLGGGLAGIYNPNSATNLDQGGNLNTPPLFEASLSGTWTHDSAYTNATGETVLRDDTASWAPGELVGRLLNPNTTNTLLYFISANAGQTVTVLGAVTNVLASSGYEIVDFHLSPASPCIDQANPAVAPDEDVARAIRPRGLGFDIGAYETLLTGDSAAPGGVTALSAVGGQAQVQLNWTNPAENDFAAVLVLRRAGAAPTGIPVATNTYFTGDTLGDGTVAYVGPGSNPTPGAPASFTNIDLDDQFTYHYAVFALDRTPNYGVGAATSATTEADATPPSPISALTAVATDAQIAFTWTNPPQADYAGVLVLRRVEAPPTGAPANGNNYAVNDAIGNGTVVYRGPASTSTPGAQASWTDTGLPNETNYYYRLFAYDEQPLYSTASETNGYPVARKIVYVNLNAAPSGDGSSWASAYASLTQALARAGSGTNLWVAAGTYKPGNLRSATFQLTNGCALYGGFSGTENSVTLRDWVTHATILSGEIGGPANTDNVLHVVTATGANGAVLDGFTVTRGYAWESGNDSDPSRNGGGLLLWEGPGVPVSTTIRNCRFVDNAANYVGGAICLNYSQGASVGAVISNCVFEENYTFRNNDGYGGAIYTYHYRPLWIYDSTFTSNRSFYAGAIRSNLGDLIMHRSVFRANVATQNVGAVWNSRSNTANLNDLEMVDCTFAANQAQYYGAVRVERNFLTSDVIRRCRFYANRSTVGGGAALHLYAYNGLVEDTILSGNAVSGGNNGGAVYLEYAAPTFRNVAIVGTETHYRGGAVYGTTHPNYSAPARFENVLIAGNLTRYDGGGVCLYDYTGSTGSFVNCTIVENRTYDANPTTYGGGALYARGCGIAITNSILYGNSSAGAGSQVRVSLAVPLQLGYSDLEGGVAAIHNPDGAPISTGAGMQNVLPGFQVDVTGTWSGPAAFDPSTGLTIFSNTAAAWAPGGLVGKYLNPNSTGSNLVYFIAGNTPSTITILGDASKVTNAAAFAIRDYKLKAISACVDAGTVVGVTNDFTGALRPQGYGFDLGAFERIPDGLPPEAVSGLAAIGGLDQIALTWINPAATDFAGVLVVRRSGTAPVGEPVSTNVYTVGQSIGNGTVVYLGSGNNAAPGEASGWTDSGRDQLTTYHYAVYAYDSVPNFATRVDASATTVADGATPAPVTSFVAVGGTQQAILSWFNSISADNNGVLILRRDGATPPTGIPATGVTYSEGNLIGDGSVVYVGAAGNATPGAAASWTNTGLNNLSRYAYTVFAYDEVPNYATGAGDEALTGLPGVVFVNDDASGGNTGGNWDDAFTDLQDALRTANPGNQIWVAAGTYYPTNGTSRAAHYRLRANINLYGGFRGNESAIDERIGTNHASVLSGDIGTPGNVFDNCSRVVLADNVSGIEFDGFTVRDGYNDSDFAGGLQIQGGPITVNNCIFEYNYAAQAGAIQVNAGATISRCIFRYNSSGSRAGAVQTYSQPATIRNCLFHNNSCGGVGGALNIYHNVVNVENCTFADNSADDATAVYTSNGGDMLAQNCIFWDEGVYGGGVWPKQPGGSNEGHATVTFSNVRGDFNPPANGSGSNNIDADPLFEDPTGGNYRLQPTSPSIDSGSSNGAPTHDLDGGARPFGSGIDMGAYEFGATGPGTPPVGLMLLVR